MAATKSPFQLAVYGLDDDRIASEVKEPPPEVVVEQSFPQMGIKPKSASTQEIKPEDKLEAQTSGKPSDDTLKYAGPEIEERTPPTTLPEAETPHEKPPRPAIKHRAKLARRGADPLVSSSCKCCLM